MPTANEVARADREVAAAFVGMLVALTQMTQQRRKTKAV